MRAKMFEKGGDQTGPDQTGPDHTMLKMFEGGGDQTGLGNLYVIAATSPWMCTYMMVYFTPAGKQKTIRLDLEHPKSSFASWL